ncbi:hypothetical protein OXT66_07775 [Lentilactobacillus senioris]|uniref:hypothetical protein n=1 Tax=Lentilactobacillus senioris TaxID=931534 RepID=UPI00227F12FA|nr:hypothetical protein [Lentilactobacillus senioris]MCY9807430.1 hypothetical protein [Lentilactobacillus senioris]
MLLLFVWVMQRAINHMIKLNQTDIACLFAINMLLAFTEAVPNGIGQNILILGMLAYVGYDRLSSVEYSTVNQFNFTRQYGLM